MNLRHFTQSPALLAEVDDDTTSAVLSLLYGFFNAEDEIRAAGADIRTENVTSVALKSSIPSC
jgi:hypothetical protein